MAEGARGTGVAGTGGPLRLCTATRDDLALLRRWDEAPHVIASDPHDDWQWEAELGVERAGREQLIAEVDGRPIGTSRSSIRRAIRSVTGGRTQCPACARSTSGSARPMRSARATVRG